MLTAAAEKYNIDLTKSYMIGDSTSDIAAGASAGCRVIGVKTGIGLSDGKYSERADKICDDLLDAVRWILGIAA
jgi:phosphoglycolate phosphatase-like HAD superfamily hydrolase